ncbi:hypothetical protein TWF173_005700 [Orbilia oligospora]|uniref:Uncharacterized protein n=1 Tax=Orbilia oligospora TaxID=2813651 RepID=A0A7C8RFX2_ORBOL|nr:hypothetical protein TWF970_004724 [Orbilia oligospora]KAF3313627.1 hypothetical protein TWF173_005700 [Orbilia oligospora]
MYGQSNPSHTITGTYTAQSPEKASDTPFFLPRHHYFLLLAPFLFSSLLPFHLSLTPPNNPSIPLSFPSLFCLYSFPAQWKSFISRLVPSIRFLLPSFFLFIF